MSYQFNYTTSERRASTAIAGSLGRSGLFIPQDFINYKKKDINNALNSMEDGDFQEENYSAIDEYDEEEQTTDSEINNHVNINRKKSIQILSDEAELLKINGIPISDYGSAYTGNSNLTRNLNSNSSLSVNELVREESEIIESWDEAIKNGKIKTNINFELKILTKSSIPLVLTFLLQNSLSVCSIFAVGHISSEALAGITLGAMTSNITAIATICGLASSLDTFLPQAYGAKKYHLVGLIFQRCSVLIFTIMFFVCISWWIWSEKLLLKCLPDKQSAIYASQYLKVTSLGMPGYILFETGKRFLQCQGVFDASTYVLIVCAPLNALLNYLLVWVFKFGYIGAPIAVSINYTLMALGLFLYTIKTKNKINPMKCWTTFEINKAFRNWNELIKLSIPNLIMIMSEFLSFEILTLLASYLGTIPLASQSIIATMASLTYQIPYGVSIASSTRIANFLGAQLSESAFITCKSTYIFTILIAILNSSILYFGKSIISNLFSNDGEVIKLTEEILPIIAIMQIFDALNTTSAGCLRGEGLQKIGGYVNLFSYYLIGLPLGAYLGFTLNYGIAGLWYGSTIALFIIGFVQLYFSINADFDKLVEDAVRRSNSD